MAGPSHSSLRSGIGDGPQDMDIDHPRRWIFGSPSLRLEGAWMNRDDRGRMGVPRFTLLSANPQGSGLGLTIFP